MSINSSNDNLTTLPSEIGNSSNLEHLAVYNNINLTTLPPEIVNLTNLQELVILNASLTTLPPEIGNLTNLREFNISNTGITELPPNLQVIDLIARNTPLHNPTPEAPPPQPGNIEIIIPPNPVTNRISLSENTPTHAFDIIQQDDVIISEFLSESPRNKIYKFNENYFAIDGNMVINHYLSEGCDYISFPCKSIDTSIVPRVNNLEMNKPLFALKNIIVTGGYVSYGQFRYSINSQHQWFEIQQTDSIKIPSVASCHLLHEDANAVSAHHCQDGIGSTIYSIAFFRYSNRG